MIYECFIPELLKYCYVKASSKKEAEKKASEYYGNVIAVCKKTKIVPRNVRVIG